MTSTTYGGSDGFEDQSFRAAQHFKHGAVVLEKGEDSAGYWNRSTQRQLAVDGYLEPVMEFPAAPELLPATEQPLGKIALEFIERYEPIPALMALTGRDRLPMQRMAIDTAGIARGPHWPRPGYGKVAGGNYPAAGTVTVSTDRLFFDRLLNYAMLGAACQFLTMLCNGWLVVRGINLTQLINGGRSKPIVLVPDFWRSGVPLEIDLETSDIREPRSRGRLGERLILRATGSPPTAGKSAASELARTLATRWLRELADVGPPVKSKPKYMAEAQMLYPDLTQTTFNNRVWPDATTYENGKPKPGWRQAGRRKNQQGN